MSDSSCPVIYQLKVVVLGISPMIWRRLLVKSNSTIEDLHYTLQIAMGWEDIHLHQFVIHGKLYGITQPGGIIFSDRASAVKLSRFGFRVKERFIYEYDFSIHPAMGAWRYWWRHEIRFEAILTPQANQIYPVCVGGKGVCPPEDCGGPWGFMEKRQDYSVWHLKRALQLNARRWRLGRTSLLASGLSKNSRCVGRRKVLIFCSRYERGFSTESSNSYHKTCGAGSVSESDRHLAGTHLTLYFSLLWTSNGQKWDSRGW